MLVFGESILNDAVAIVLTNVIVESKRQLQNINTTKLTTYSMIGLLTSSNLSTIPSITTSPRYQNHNGLIQNNGQISLRQPTADVSSAYSRDNDKYPSTNNEVKVPTKPFLYNKFMDKNNIPSKKGTEGNFSKL